MLHERSDCDLATFDRLTAENLRAEANRLTAVDQDLRHLSPAGLAAPRANWKRWSGGPQS